MEFVLLFLIPIGPYQSRNKPKELTSEVAHGLRRGVRRSAHDECSAAVAQERCALCWELDEGIQYTGF